MQKVITAREFQDNLLIEQGIEQGIEKGIEQGIEQGRFEMALKIKAHHGIDKAVELSGFSREDLENEKLNMLPPSI